MQTLKIKVIDPSIPTTIPHYATAGSAGLDLVATSKEGLADYIEYGTNLAFEIPVGYVGLIFPRSSITKTDMNLKNCVGVIDADYRGEVTFRFQYSTDAVVDLVEILGQALASHLDGQTLAESLALLERHTTDFHPLEYQVGDKIGQLVILPLPRFQVQVVETLSGTARGENGYGSTGR